MCIIIITVTNAYVFVQVLNYQTEESIDEFEKECTTMRMAKHPNIVRMLGICIDDEESNMCLLMEYCCMGNLRNYLLSKAKVCVKRSQVDFTREIYV